MVKWHEIIKEYPLEQPYRLFKHFRHEVYTELYNDIEPKRQVCRTCKVWWYKITLWEKIELLFRLWTQN